MMQVCFMIENGWIIHVCEKYMFGYCRVLVWSKSQQYGYNVFKSIFLRSMRKLK